LLGVNLKKEVKIIVITIIVTVLILAIGGYFAYLDIQKQQHKQTNMQSSKKSIVDTATAEKYQENVKQNATPTKGKADILGADRIFKENSKAVVVVIAYDEKGNAISQGSGFIVRADGAVVTNYHVISKARDIKVKTGDKVLDVEGLIFTDKENDLVILKAKAKDMPVVELGDAYMKLGMHKEAIEACKQSIRIDPDLAKAHHSLGLAYGNLGMVKQAMDAFKQAIRIDPDLAKAHHSLGLAYSDLGMVKEAIDAFKQVIRIDPDNAKVHYCLGLVYVASNDKGSALEQYKILKSLDSEKANQLFNLIYE